MTPPALDTIGIPVRHDNIAWLLPVAPGRVAVVDPGASEPILAELRQRGWQLAWILITHHHADHLEGTLALQAATQARVVGWHGDRHRLPPLDLAVTADGQEIHLDTRRLTVLHTPGHTQGHVVYLTDQGELFSGDTLFPFGCGRLFEGTPEQMWQALCRLAALPDETRLFPGHEYTLANLRFAQHLAPGHPGLAAAHRTACHRLDEGLLTSPCSLAEQKRFNPFLQCHDPHSVFLTTIPAAPPVERFRRLRELRNTF